jgi:fatty-acid desaturase
MFQLTAKRLFFFQLISHLLLIYWLVFDFSLVGFAKIVFVYFLTGCIGMSMTYHRLLTHKAWTAPKYFEYIGTILATIGGTGSSLSWTATHRKHHVHTDKEGDPHSPSVIGYFKAQWFSMFSPVDVKRSPVLGSEFHRWVHRNYFLVLLIYFLVLLLSGLNTIEMFFAPAAVLWNAGSLINTVCHTKLTGYRNFETRDNSVNNPLLGYLMWGEGWHNNHHKNQMSSDFKVKWWEFDISYQLIKLLKITK